MTYTSFLVPTTLSLIPTVGAKPEDLKSLPPRFNAEAAKLSWQRTVDHFNKYVKQGQGT